MAESRDMTVKVEMKFDTAYPKVPSTIEERTQALKDAKGLLTSTNNGGMMGALVGASQGGVQQNNDGTLALMRLAEYMVVGHDYLDTHPVDTQTGPSKKERRQAAKEMRRIIAEEVAEELDKRQREAAGKLIIPETFVRNEDGTQTPIADYYRRQTGAQEEDGSVTVVGPEDSDDDTTKPW